MGIKEDIKILLLQENSSIKKIAEEMTKISGKKYTGTSISQKLYKKTLRCEEAKLIGEILGYELKFIKK